jgi:hypothetical protein
MVTLSLLSLSLFLSLLSLSLSSLLSLCLSLSRDLCTFNNNGMMAKLYPEIYEELSLKRESTVDGKEAHFLETDIIVDSGFVHTGIYDKRDDFGFRVVTFPTLPTNSPLMAAHGLLIAQLLRFAQVNDTLTGFHERASLLTEKLVAQGFKKELLEKKCKTFYTRNEKLLRKYVVTKEVILAGCFTKKTFFENVDGEESDNLKENADWCLLQTPQNKSGYCQDLNLKRSLSLSLSLSLLLT